MRADALRNRQRVIEAGREVFAEAGAQASLEEVARRAGVGIGTLYRHFPSREALIAEIYRHAALGLGEAARRLAQEAGPRDALLGWLDLFIDYLGTKRLLGAVLDTVAADSSEMRAAAGAQIRDAVRLLADRAVAAGAITEEADPVDLLRALHAVLAAPDLPEADGPPRARRLARVLVAGLARAG